MNLDGVRVDGGWKKCDLEIKFPWNSNGILLNFVNVVESYMQRIDKHTQTLKLLDGMSVTSVSQCETELINALLFVKNCRL